LAFLLEHKQTARLSNEGVWFSFCSKVKEEGFVSFEVLFFSKKLGLNPSFSKVEQVCEGKDRLWIIVLIIIENTLLSHVQGRVEKKTTISDT